MGEPSHQDWDQVYLINKEARQKEKPRETVKRTTQTAQSDVDPEKNPIAKVPNDLKQRFIAARCAAKLTRVQIAKQINEPEKSITMLETGQMLRKDAKQICIKVERKLKVKLLNKE